SPACSSIPSSSSLYFHAPPSHLRPFPTRRSSDLVTGVCFSTVTSSHTSIAVLYQRPVLGLYEPEFQLRPPAIQGQMKAGLPSRGDRKSTRLNSSHLGTSYAVFCLKKKRAHALPQP